MAYFRCGSGGGTEQITFKYYNGYTSPLPTSGSFTIGGNAGGILFLNCQFKKATISNKYGGFTYKLKNGSTRSVSEGTNIDISDVLAIYPNAIPGTGYTNFFTYSFT